VRGDLLCKHGVDPLESIRCDRIGWDRASTQARKALGEPREAPTFE
jgi:hypothetical protein